jgi:dihydroorotate dehydrogenase
MIWNLLRPLLFSFSPEKAHQLAFSQLELIQRNATIRQWMANQLRVEDKRLKSTVFGLEFSNPVGLAAGFDKNARILPMWHALGFGFAELGTITPRPQSGNPAPRLFRLPEDLAVINRMGFNNDGAEGIRGRLLEYLNSGIWPSMPVGINLGKQKETSLEKAAEDYAVLLDSFLDLGDYFVVNVSSPNTPGLRELQEKTRLDELLAMVQSRVRSRCLPHIRPVLMKIAPDLEYSQLDDVLELCLKHGLAGIIATNTTLSREGLTTRIDETGGLSGMPLRKRSTDFVRYIHEKVSGKLKIIGVGGVFSAEDAYEKIQAGASLIQVYTGFVYEGPAMARNINRGLLKLLERDGVKHISEVVGVTSP